MQRNSYIRCYKQYMSMWHLKSTDKQGLVEIRQLFEIGFYTIFSYGLLTVLGEIGYLPLNGLQIDNNIFPAIACTRHICHIHTSIPTIFYCISVIKLFENGPKILIYSIVVINYALLFLKGIGMVLYGMHIMHACILYNVQSILLRRRLRNICYDNFKVSPLLLIDNIAYQKWVQDELKECIKQDIKLKQ